MLGGRRRYIPEYSGRWKMQRGTRGLGPTYLPMGTATNILEPRWGRVGLGSWALGEEVSGGV